MNNEDKLKKVMTLLCAALFVVATALGIPVSESLLNVGQQQQRGKGGSLRISDECEEEIKDIPIYGDVSEPCKKELTKLHRKIERVENLCREAEN